MKHKKISKFIKISIICLICLNSTVLINNFLAQEEKRQHEQKIQDLYQKYPLVRMNKSAKKLDLLLIDLGLQPMKQEIFSQDKNIKNDLWQEIKSEIHPFLVEQLGQDFVQNITIPSKFVDFLEINKSKIEEIISHLNKTEKLLWDFDIGDLYQDNNPVFYSFFNDSGFGLVNLQRILMLQALYYDAQNKTEEVNQVLEASFKLNQSLQKQPHVLAQILAIFSSQYQIGILRQLRNLSPQWQEKLTDYYYDYEQGYINSLDLELIMFSSPFLDPYEGNNNLSKLWLKTYAPMAGKEIAGEIRKIIPELFSQNICSQEQEKMSIKSHNLSFLNPYAYIIPDYYKLWLKSGNIMLDYELTANILAVKFSASQDNNLPKVDFKSSEVCPQEKWQINRRQKELEISFSNINSTMREEMGKDHIWLPPLKFISTGLKQK